MYTRVARAAVKEVLVWKGGRKESTILLILSQGRRRTNSNSFELEVSEAPGKDVEITDPTYQFFSFSLASS